MPLTIVASVDDLIGRTPMLRLGAKTAARHGVVANILLKLESLEPCSSVKDRMAKVMIEEAERRGDIVPGKTLLVEPTSGNTGIGLAMVGAAKGYDLTLVMPASMSLERRVMLKALGAKVVLTPPDKGMAGAVSKANEIVKRLAPDSFMLNQFDNLDNSKCHREVTGPEIWEQVGGEIDILVAGVGTGGTITGIAQHIKPLNPRLHVVAVEPAESAVLSGGKPGPHKIQGIGTGFIPGNFRRDMVDEIMAIDSDTAIQTAKRLAVMEGVFVGISSGAALACALRVGARPENAGKNLVVIIPSFGERYLSSAMFKDLQEEAIYQAIEPIEEVSVTTPPNGVAAPPAASPQEDPFAAVVPNLEPHTAAQKSTDESELDAVHQELARREHELDPDAVRVLRYWFKRSLPACLDLWFGKDEATDAYIEREYKPLILRARRGELNHWIHKPQECLALVILLDQFPRNIFRFNPEMYSCDEMALSVVTRAMFNGHHQQVRRVEACFFCLVLTHSENINHQELCLELWATVTAQLSAEDPLKKFDDIFRKHVTVIAQFGRFPHRNKILRRCDTVDEATFLQDLNFRFDLPLKADCSGFQTSANFEDRGKMDRYDWDYGL